MLVERFHSKLLAAMAFLALLATAFMFVELNHSAQHSQLAKVEQTQSIHPQFVEVFDDKPCHPHSGADCQTFGSTTCPHSCGLVFSMDTPEPFDNRAGISVLKSRLPDSALGGNLFRPPIVLS